ncbi:MAG TPA: hypothetical protein VL688_08260 [Verrucomicrobiae bacterium]|nr:hypothetical protein [Verrucomicrobiae bacterium]
MVRIKKSLAAFSLLFVSGMLVLPFAKAGEVAYTGPVAGPTPVYCTAIDPSHPMPDESTSPEKRYYTGAFMGDVNLNPARASFYKFLQEKYGYTENPSYGDQSITCYASKTLDDAQARLAKQKQVDKTAIDTGWTPAA